MTDSHRISSQLRRGPLLANTPLDLSFNVDLASGAIPFGRLAFALPNSGGFVEGRFSGQVRFDTDYQYLDVGFSDGFFGAAPLDLLESEIQGFFSGPNAEQFVGGFSLLADSFESDESFERLHRTSEFGGGAFRG